MKGSGQPAGGGDSAAAGTRPPVLSVVVPVFNQASSIVANLRTIRERVAHDLDGAFEVVVVSDGSIDATEDELLSSSREGEFRVFHYDRNLGKGFAVKLGALEARGDWIGFIDADLDLDPAGLAEFVRVAQEEGLDFAIGSKRHPDSNVHYPRSRIVASWLFQQMVWLLFRLEVRDTQVGLKVFRREVAEQVLPFLLVKRYAFDLELLAVARVFGFDRIGELPITLDYQFTGSGVRSRAVLRALMDTGAIFYRLRILRYYQRRRALTGTYGWTRPRENRPTVSVLVPPGAQFRERDYKDLELIELPDGSSEAVRAAAARAKGEVLAVLEPGARAAANWISATAPFFGRSEIAVVVTPKIAPLGGSLRQRAAAAVDESRLGGLVYFRYTPGNVGFVDDFPSATFVVRRQTFLELPTTLALEEVPAAVASSGARVLYTPESVVVSPPPPLFRPHLSHAFSHGLKRGLDLRRGRLSTVRGSAVVVFVFLLAGGIAGALAFVGGGARIGLLGGVLVVYGAAVTVVGAAATFRFQSLSVGALAAVGTVATHVIYLSGVARGFFR